MKRYLLLYLCIAFSQSTLAEKSTHELAGDIGQVALPVGALVASLSDGQYQDTQQFLASFSTTFIITHIGKNLIDAKRPDGSDHSFPSGHTASAFSGAAFLHTRYGWKVGVPAYAAASYVGWSRIYAQRHWPRDVLAGATLAVSSHYFYDWLFKRKIKASALISRNFSGIHLNGDF